MTRPNARMEAMLRNLMFLVLWMLLDLWAPQTLAQDMYQDRIGVVAPQAAGSNVYAASFSVFEDTSPLIIDHNVVRSYGNTIDLVAFQNVGAFSVPGLAQGSASLGALAPGQYTLRLLSTSNTLQGGGFGPEVLQDTLQFTVGTGSVNPVPALGQQGLMALAAIIMQVGIWAWRYQGR